MQRLFMRKTSFLPFLSILTIACVLMGCPSSSTPPLSERIAKAWTARIVTENGTTAYTRGGTTNTRPTYSSFKLDLSSAPTVRYTASDGNTYVGQYSVQDNPQQLTLTNLQPSLTGGNTITFTISSISDTELVLARTSGDPKTGNSNNVYTLSNP